MALTLTNPEMKLNVEQLVDLMRTRTRPGYHIFYQGDGASTTNEYMFGLPGHPVSGNAEIAVAMEIPLGFQTFEFKFDYSEGNNHIHYKFPRSPGSKEAFAIVQYNQKDNPIEVAASDAMIFPGVHVLRIRVSDDDQSVQFYTDSAQLFQDTVYNVENTDVVRIKNDNGRVFEAHYVADNDSDVFESEGGNDPNYAPGLTPGSFVSVSGSVAFSTTTSFMILERSKLDKTNKNPSVTEKYKIHYPADTQDLFYYVKFFKNYLIIDGGQGMQVIKHNFKAPQDYFPTDLYTKDVIVVLM
ncbi:uncharacterized protein LOC119405329 [Rhipicephalus sanguineus]|uniref:uncharacterized protein LOC119405329 n=1 Tax=Rhipicephalus sanguineus TaxID=34632 RepID=UPI001895329E|nr:uncharacterized protein LOC119405329 [Rhipicephalus sanguineus]